MQLDFPRKRVCDVLDAPRSTIYAREGAAVRDETGVVIAFPKRGSRTELSWPAREWWLMIASCAVSLSPQRKPLSE